MLTEKIKEQIFAVRDSGAANMCEMVWCRKNHLHSYRESKEQ